MDGRIVTILETPTFTRQVPALLEEESYRRLQLELVANPERGVLMPGSGGLRKLRWQRSGVGKRAGVRVIYYWATAEQIILLLVAYTKSERDDLTPDQVKVLRRAVEEEFG